MTRRRLVPLDLRCPDAVVVLVFVVAFVVVWFCCLYFWGVCFDFRRRRGCMHGCGDRVVGAVRSSLAVVVAARGPEWLVCRRVWCS